jgi:hypothetical protein
VGTRQTTTKLEQTVSRSAGNHAGAVSLCAQGITMMLSGLSSAVGTCHQQGPERKVLTTSQISSSSGIMRRKSSMTEFAVDKSPLATTSVTHYLTRPKRALVSGYSLSGKASDSRPQRPVLCDHGDGCLLTSHSLQRHFSTAGFGLRLDCAVCSCRALWRAKSAHHRQWLGVSRQAAFGHL